MTADQVDRPDEPGCALFRKRPERSVPVGVVRQLTVAVDVHGADRGLSSTNCCRVDLPSLEYQALGQVAVERWAADSDNEIGCDGGTKAIGRSLPAAGGRWFSAMRTKRSRLLATRSSSTDPQVQPTLPCGRLLVPYHGINGHRPLSCPTFLSLERCIPAATG